MRFRLALIMLALLGAGCAGAPRAPVQGDSPGAALARIASSFLGTPYRHGGSTPAGFDCSGLVLHVHEQLGFTVPRTAAEQQRAALAVPVPALEPGDLVFFRIASRGVDHVGIYAGQGRFIHAPRSGRPVSYARVDDPYFRKRLVGAGRFWGR